VFEIRVFPLLDGLPARANKLHLPDKFNYLDTIVKISHYLYDTEIEKPKWFDEHRKGMGKGRMGKKGKNQ